MTKTPTDLLLGRFGQLILGLIHKWSPKNLSILVSFFSSFGEMKVLKNVKTRNFFQNSIAFFICNLLRGTFVDEYFIRTFAHNLEFWRIFFNLE